MDGICNLFRAECESGRAIGKESLFKFCFDEAWADGEGMNAVGASFSCDGLCVSVDPRFRGSIDTEADKRIDGGHGGDVDDGALPLFQHNGPGGGDSVIDSFDIETDCVAKFGRWKLIDGSEACGTGVIDEHINAFPLDVYFVDEVFEGLRICDVECLCEALIV